MADTTPEAKVLTASIAANTAMTIAIPAAVIINSLRRPACSIKYHVPNEATRNQISRKPDMSKAMWRENPIEFWKLAHIVSTKNVASKYGSQGRFT